MKDIILPTIERKFRQLHMLRTTMSDGDLNIIFRDDDKNEFIDYLVALDILWVNGDYFMLRYFGDLKENKELFKEIFIDLLNDYFERIREDIVLNKDVGLKLFWS